MIFSRREHAPQAVPGSLPLISDSIAKKRIPNGLFGIRHALQSDYFPKISCAIFSTSAPLLIAGPVRLYCVMAASSK